MDAETLRAEISKLNASHLKHARLANVIRPRREACAACYDQEVLVPFVRFAQAAAGEPPATSRTPLGRFLGRAAEVAGIVGSDETMPADDWRSWLRLRRLAEAERSNAAEEYHHPTEDSKADGVPAPVRVALGSYPTEAFGQGIAVANLRFGMSETGEDGSLFREPHLPNAHVDYVLELKDGTSQPISGASDHFNYDFHIPVEGLLGFRNYMKWGHEEAVLEICEGEVSAYVERGRETLSLLFDAARNPVLNPDLAPRFLF